VGGETIGTEAGGASGLDPRFPCHALLLGADKCGLTQLQNLAKLPPIGALVIAALDKTVREETNGSNTFQDVFHDLNTHTGPIDHATFRRYVKEAGGQPAATAADRYATTTTRPSLWDQATHARVFQTTTPVISYQLPPTNNTTYTLTGPYRSSTTNTPLVLVPNETLSIPVTISNTGTRTGTYEITLTSASTTLARETGRIDPGTTRTITIDEQFTAPGTYFLNTTDHAIPIHVREPATPRIRNLTASPTQTTPDAPVTITATATNPTDVPAVGTLTITANTQQIHTERLELTPGETTTITTTYTPTEPGTITIATANHSLALTVTEPPTPTPTPSPQAPTTPTPTTPGFTIPLTIFALLIASRAR
jgi:hypothetical protein